MIKTTGTLKFFDKAKGFGFAETPHGDVRIGHEAVTGVNVADLVGGAEVALEVLFGQKGLDAVAVTSVTLTFKTGVIRWFSKEKRMGFIAQADENEKDVFLSLAVATEAGAVPWEGLVVEYVVGKGKDGGLTASKVRFPEVAARVASLEARFGNGATSEKTVEVVDNKSAPVEEASAYVLGETLTGKVKWFNGAKGYGMLVVPGKRDLFVHVSQTKAVGELEEGIEVTCEVGESKKGPQALNLRLPGTEAPAVVADDVVRLFEATPAVEKPKKIRIRQKREGGEQKAPPADHVSMLVVSELPDSPMAAGLQQLGLVAVAAQPNGLDQSPPQAGQPVN